MAQPVYLSPDEDELSQLVDASSLDTLGFCQGYPLRRHKYEAEANEGSRCARMDWMRYIGPIEKFGGCNPHSGHFGALTLPLCDPQRLRIVSYVFEYAFVYDQHLESAEKATFSNGTENAGLDEVELLTVSSIVGTKQIQSKMILELLQIDDQCAQVVIDSWKEMVSTTATLDKKKTFDNMEDYIEYRIIDTGAPFVDKLMRFGMGMRLTQEEERLVSPIARPCYAALGLANDFFSFDEEYKEFKTSKATTLTNAVWLFMQWHDVDVASAKEMVKKQTNRYEEEFQQLKDIFELQYPKEIKLQDYLKGLAYQVSGNVAWSLKCPRYHPEYRYDLDTRTISVDGQDLAMDEFHPSNKQQRTPSIDSSASGDTNEDSTCASSVSSFATDSRSLESKDNMSDANISNSGTRSRLGPEHVIAPLDYLKSLPSKGVREAFIDALNVWLHLPEKLVNQVKTIVQTLHNASLMLDDVEDSSPLRRNKPSVHMVFGQAQTINSANYSIICALRETMELENAQCIDIFVEELQNLHIGQSWDLFWTRSCKPPSEEEYLEMVDKKTGGLFCLTVRLMVAVSNNAWPMHLEQLAIVLGRFFQIRDDYQNLASTNYTDAKGFCEDLDEGKYSFPMVHASSLKPHNLQLSSIVLQRGHQHGLSKEQKQLILEHLHQSRSMDHTRDTLKQLSHEILNEITRIEKMTRSKNWILRLLVHKLRVD